MNIEGLRVADRIRSDKYRIFNKELAHYYGLKESIYLAYLVDQDYFFNKNNIGEKFYKEQKYIYIETSLSYDDCRRINNKLIKDNVLQIVKEGMPAKNYFKINYTQLEYILDSSMQNYQELLNNLKEDPYNKNNSSSRKIQEQDPEYLRNINNKDINNKDSLSKDKEVSVNETSLNENKLNNNKDIKDKLNGEHLVSSDTTLSNTREAQPGELKEETFDLLKDKKGLGPLLNMAEEIFPRSTFPDLYNVINNYLHAYIGHRHLPTPEKWKEMLNQLVEYSSIRLPGAMGNKFLTSRAIKIVEKALDGKNGNPFTEFDPVVKRNSLMEPEFNLNQNFTKGY